MQTLKYCDWFTSFHWIEPLQNKRKETRWNSHKKGFNERYSWYSLFIKTEFATLEVKTFGQNVAISSGQAYTINY